MNETIVLVSNVDKKYANLIWFCFSIFPNQNSLHQICNSKTYPPLRARERGRGHSIRFNSIGFVTFQIEIEMKIEIELRNSLTWYFICSIA